MTHADQRPTPIYPQRRCPCRLETHEPRPTNPITPPSSSTSISSTTLRRKIGFILQWRLGFEVLIDEPWRGGAQIVKLRETEATGKERRGK